MPDALGAAAELEHLFGAPATEVITSPIVLLGSVLQIVERLHERREQWGYTYFTIQQALAHEFAPVIARL
ncbi:hypothetical protein ACFQ10_51580 [Streptomyces indonesiensis]